MTSESAVTELRRRQETEQTAFIERRPHVSLGTTLVAVGAAFLLADHLQEAHIRVDRAKFDQAAAEIAARPISQQVAMVMRPIASVVLVCKETAATAHDPQKIALALATQSCLVIPAPQVSGFGFPHNYYHPASGAYGLRTTL